MYVVGAVAANKRWVIRKCRMSHVMMAHYSANGHEIEQIYALCICWYKYIGTMYGIYNVCNRQIRWTFSVGKIQHIRGDCHVWTIVM